jgi:hypothetical protein
MILTPDERDDAYRQATSAATAATQQMRWSTDPQVRADIASATADILHVAAAATGNRHLARAADSYDRTACEPYGRQPAPTPYGSTLRAAARILAIACLGVRGRRDRGMELTVELLILIAQLAALAEAAAEFRDAQQRSAQAEAARTSASHLHRAGRKPSATLAPEIQRPTVSRNAAEIAAADFPVPPDQMLGRAAWSRTPAASPRPERAPSRPRGPRR